MSDALNRVFRWEGGVSTFLFEFEGDIAEVYKHLSQRDEGVLLKGYNFQPVSNFSHFSSLGILDDDVDSILLSSPAHFNPVFYYLNKL